MISAVTQTKPVSLKRQRDLAQQSPYVMNRFARVMVRRERAWFHKQIDKPVRKPPDPFIWSHDGAANLRARKWYFAAIRDERIKTENGRYKRTGKMKKSAFVDANLRNLDGLVTMGFRGEGSEGANYVYGPRQIPGHRAYPRLSTLATKSAERQSRQSNTFWRVYNATGNVGEAIEASGKGLD